MNNSIDLNFFLSFKDNKDSKKLDNETLVLLNSLFNNNNNNNKDKIINPILKNQKIQNNKDLLLNKTNLILNKLSESNIENLILEFIENIKTITNEEFEEIQKIFYIKIILDINFVKIYLNFFKNIVFLYNKVFNYNFNFFIEICENKFRLDYQNINIDNKFNFLNEYQNEEKRINNLILLNNLFNLKFLSNKLLSQCNEIILNQNKYYYDIYFWINLNNIKITNNEINKFNKGNITNREKILLNSLLDNNNKIKTDENIEDEKEINEINNAIDEYLLLKIFPKINNKNKFIEILLEKYFISNSLKSKEILNLIEILIENKKDFIKYLEIINNNWEDKNIDYIDGENKKKNLLNIFIL